MTAPINETNIPKAVFLLSASPRKIIAKIAMKGTLKFIRIDEFIADVNFKAYT